MAVAVFSLNTRVEQCFSMETKRGSILNGMSLCSSVKSQSLVTIFLSADVASHFHSKLA